MPFATDIYAAFYTLKYFLLFQMASTSKERNAESLQTMTDEEALLPIFRDRAIVCRLLDIMKPFAVSGDFFFFLRD